MRHHTPGPDPEPTALDSLEQALDRATLLDIPQEECPRGDGARAAGMSFLFTAAVVVLTVIAAYLAATTAYERSAAHTDRRVGVLERDLTERRARNAEQNAARDQQIAELRRLVCVFADHAQPRDADVERVRAEYGCAGQAPVRPRTSVSPVVPLTPGAPGTSRVGMPRPAPAPPRDAPTPERSVLTSVPPNPAPGSPIGVPVVCVNLPLLPLICL